ncbi:hypothetical protein BKA64DRAFT_749312 [Cadophora sp. MPI-SDFR-AT-0126]|nr:hypothetical protein BKA64DRAFT_749312 [Leotiomycetes sp. MPI-SDFR-AT-0126]
MASGLTQPKQELAVAEEIIVGLRRGLSDLDDHFSRLISDMKRKLTEIKSAQTAPSRSNPNVSPLRQTVDDLIAHVNQQTIRIMELENHESNNDKLRSVLDELDRLKATHVRVVAEREWYRAKTQRCLEVLGAVESSRSEIHDCVRGIGSFYIEHCNRLSRQLEQIWESDKELQEDLRQARLEFSDIKKSCDNLAAEEMAED